MVAPRERAASNARMDASSCSSSGFTFSARHASLQYFTCSHVRAHRLRHAMRRPQRAQVFSTSMKLELRAVSRLRNAEWLLYVTAP